MTSSNPTTPTIPATPTGRSSLQSDQDNSQSGTEQHSELGQSNASLDRGSVSADAVTTNEPNPIFRFHNGIRYSYFRCANGLYHNRKERRFFRNIDDHVPKTPSHVLTSPSELQQAQPFDTERSKCNFRGKKTQVYVLPCGHKKHTSCGICI